MTGRGGGGVSKKGNRNNQGSKREREYILFLLLSDTPCTLVHNGQACILSDPLPSPLAATNRIRPDSTNNPCVHMVQLAMPKSDRDAAVLSCLPLCRKLAASIRRKASRPIDRDAFEDLVSQAQLLCLEAFEVFDPARNVPFVAFASLYVSRRLRQYVFDNHVTPTADHTFLAEAIDEQATDSTASQDHEPAHSPHAYELAALVAGCKPLDATIVRLVCAEHLTPAQIATQLDLSVRVVKLRIRNLDRKMKGSNFTPTIASSHLSYAKANPRPDATNQPAA
jgi:RNA polymerase sigma factor (sigma-70 family)